jgi:hypothetical protein
MLSFCAIVRSIARAYSEQEENHFSKGRLYRAGNLDWRLQKIEGGLQLDL